MCGHSSARPLSRASDEGSGEAAGARAPSSPLSAHDPMCSAINQPHDGRPRGRPSTATVTSVLLPPRLASAGGLGGWAVLPRVLLSEGRLWPSRPQTVGPPRAAQVPGARPQGKRPLAFSSRAPVANPRVQGLAGLGLRHCLKAEACPEPGGAHQLQKQKQPHRVSLGSAVRAGEREAG